MRLKTLIKNKTPFAIVMHFEWIKFAPQSKNKIYELLTIKKGHLKTQKLDDSEVEEFKEIHEQMDLKIRKEDGKVWEFLNFKNQLTEVNYKKSLVETY